MSRWPPIRRRFYTALQQAYDDLRQTQQAVMQQERLRALGQMASGIAHDINNAISPVALYTESLLENEPNLSPRAREYLETIQRAIEDVAQTVARMREFYRQREPQLTLAPVDLNRLVQQVLDLTRARWSDMPQQRGIVIQRARPNWRRTCRPIAGVESEIREALTNLIFNAVDAMPEGGTLTLRTKTSRQRRRCRARSVRVEVADTGIGMDEDTRRRCLEPFFTTKGERGTGSAWRWSMAWSSGTTRRSKSKARPAQGTTVRLSFPARVRAPPPGDSAAYATAAPQRLRILVVDDDPLLIKSLRDTLEADGHVGDHGQRRPGGIDVFPGRGGEQRTVRRGDHRSGHAVRGRTQGRQRREGRLASRSGDPAHRLGPAAGGREDDTRRTWIACSASRPSCANCARRSASW